MPAFITKTMGIHHTAPPYRTEGCLPPQSAPRNITPFKPSLLQIAANRHSRECCEVLTRFGFLGKILYICMAKKGEGPQTQGFLLFFGAKNGIFTSEIEFSTLPRKIFLEFAENFSVM